MNGIVVLLVLLAWQAPSATQSMCAVSDDASYAFTPENPVQVGGGAMYVAARERRYLDALRGPQGQPVRYKRLGTTKSPNGDAILDKYEVTYDGLEKPILLYLDAYHFFEQRAPQGLQCGQPFNLDPILDFIYASDSLRLAAIEHGKQREVAAIPLDNSGDKPVHGLMWDSFRMVALDAAAAGASTRGPLPASTVVLAYPLLCDGRTVLPLSIELVNVQPSAPAVPATVVKDAAIAALLPGVEVPAGSMVARFPLQQVRRGDQVRIVYDDVACPQGTSEVVLSLTMEAGRVIEASQPALPDGDQTPNPRVLLQVIVDLDGRLQQAHYVGGPSHLRPAAVKALEQWRAEPARLNGAPMAGPMLVVVQFKPSGVQ